MSPPVLILRHEPGEGPGLLAEVLSDRGFSLEILDVWRAPVPAEPTFYAAVVVMGGSMGVYEQDRHPFLAREIELLRRAQCSGVPALGICLGSQLLAAANGARVYAGSSKEIGWYPVVAAGPAARDGLFSIWPAQTVTFHWHGDTFDLPEGAERLVSSALYPNQAFRAGNLSWGIQFHPEITGEMVTEWVGHAVRKGDMTGEASEAVLKALPVHGPGQRALGRRLFERFAGVLRERR